MLKKKQKRVKKYFVSHIKHFTNNNINWKCMSANPNIDYQFYLDNPNYP